MQSHTIPSRPWERVSADLFRQMEVITLCLWTITVTIELETLKARSNGHDSS